MEGDDVFDSLHDDIDCQESARKHSHRRKSSAGDTKKRQRRKRRMLTGVSKQRRAANERERKRLQIINDAFKDLKAILPLLPGEENISKIEIVKLASRTITYLSEIVRAKDADSGDILEEISSCSSTGCSHNSTSCCGSCSDDVLPDPSELSPVQFDTSQHGDEFDVNFLLSSSEGTKLGVLDSAPDIPSPTESNFSSKDGFDDLDLNSFIDHMDYNIAPSMVDEDELFHTSSSMIFW